MDAQNVVDGQSDIRYNANEDGDSYARTDEFRRLQAESQGMSDDELASNLRGGTNETVRGRISTIFRGQLDSWRRSGGADNGVLNLSAKGSQFNIYEDVNGALFHDVFEIAKKHLKNGELVDLHDIKTTEDGIGYDDCYNYLSEDGLSGFSITPDGDLISVFNMGSKGGFLRAISGVVSERAKTLDCYASSRQNLVEMYENAFGFKAASIMDYNMEFDHDNIAKNHGMPQVAFMVNTQEDVVTKEFSKNEYEEAVAYRNSYVSEDSTGENQSVRYSLDDRISVDSTSEATEEIVADSATTQTEVQKQAEAEERSASKQTIVSFLNTFGLSGTQYNIFYHTVFGYN